jgi:plasmid stability protein
MIASAQIRRRVMAQILVRNLDKDVVERLKQRARREGRSLQAEAKTILEGAAQIDARSAVQLAKTIRRGFRGRVFSDSAQLIREDRNR